MTLPACHAMDAEAPTGLAREIGLVIPTKNRADLVVRALRYYASVGFAGTLYLGDSSDPMQDARVQQAVTHFADQLHIEYA